MVKALVSLAAILALFVGVAPAQAAPSKDVTYQAVVPLVDDDGVTREFIVIYEYRAATRTAPASTTCTYALSTDQTPNPNDVGIYVIEGVYRAAGSPAVIANRDQAIAYCVSVFDQRQHPTGDPTPGPA